MASKVAVALAIPQLGLGSAYLAAYFSAFLWVWIGPVFILASGIAAFMATGSGTLGRRRLRWMWGLVATSAGSWVFFVWHLRMQ